MRPNPNRGRVYRRCACRDTEDKQLGTCCPRLANPRLGNWAFAVDRPTVDSKRKTMRRSGYATKTEASAALGKVLECERAGVLLDDTETVAQYLTSWLDIKSRDLRPNTVLRYRDYTNQDLIPAIGAVRLERITHEYVRQLIENQLAAGRGRVTLTRCVTTLSSALNDAVKERRLPHSPARFERLPRPPRKELGCWTTRQAEGFLRYCHRIDDQLSCTDEVFGIRRAMQNRAVKRRRMNRPQQVRRERGGSSRGRSEVVRCSLTSVWGNGVCRDRHKPIPHWFRSWILTSL
jgi:hypothetical protein